VPRLLEEVADHDAATSELDRLTPKGRATRSRIVDAAARLMFEHGVAGTSIQDVRKVARVSGWQMTHYFADKHSLIRAVVGRQLDSVLEQHGSPAPGGLDTFASLRLWAELHVERQKANDCQGGFSFGSLAGELAEADIETRADLAAGFEQWPHSKGQPSRRLCGT
jgi:AcrR family transcriptional regulator